MDYYYYYHKVCLPAAKKNLIDGSPEWLNLSSEGEGGGWARCVSKKE